MQRTGPTPLRALRAEKSERQSTMSTRGSREESILILAPTGNDARLTAEFLAKSGLVPQVCRDLVQLCSDIDHGCGAVLIAEEALETSAIATLCQALDRQPSWSD